MRIVMLLLVFAGCFGSEHREARDTYNKGLEALAKGEHETAEKLFLEARSGAGVDPELRFRSAYDLGIAYAAHADKVKGGQDGQDADLANALELTQQAVSWFSDAARLRKDDVNTQANLAIVRARVQALTDELRKAEGKLEARLDTVIRDQRAVLDEAREAWFAIKQTGGADPLAQQATLSRLADRERGVVAEVGVITDLAADEIDSIGKKPDDQRSAEEKVRVVQLKALDLYLLDARTRIAEARRKLQELAAEEGVTRAEASLVALKRAREQLLDPITVLKGIAQDEVALFQDTAAGGGGARLDIDRAGSGGAAAKDPKPRSSIDATVIPGWLQPPVLAERQGGLRDRVEEVKARLLVAVTEPVPEPDPAPAPPAGDPQAQPDPKQAKLLARVRDALPSVVQASTAMDLARQALVESKLTVALEHETKALEALARAIEQFSDLKQTVELAYAEQTQITSLLAPPSPAVQAELPAAERGKQTREALARNVERMTRLEALITDQLAEVTQQAAAPAPAPAPGAGSASPEQTKQAEEAKQAQAEQAKQQLARAEQLRGEAATALDALGKALASTRGADPLPASAQAHGKLEELRKLLFSVIEHLQQLIRDQGDTRDQTSAISGEDDLARGPKLPGLVTREEEHAAMAKAITEALAAQADAAGKQQQPPQPGAPDAKTLSAAAAEVRLAQGEMADARGAIIKVRDATKSSESLKPALTSEAKAIEHLENALRMLQPPQNKQQQQQDPPKQDPKQQQDQQQQQQPQAGAGQRARDTDAAQQKKRRDREATSDPVEQDW